MELGLRVVRGPDWKWTNQDDGEGHVGSIVEVGRAGSSTSPDKTVVVQWDSGSRTNYRVGYQGAYDLRIYDNAPIGVKHHNIVCDSCKVQGVLGMRWKCSKCHDFDLCTQCYFEDKHDLTHPFMRYATPNSPGVKVGKRAGATKVQAKGIFPNAKVVRGPDWDWGNQDGGEGKIGTAIDIRGWDNESGRSVVNVFWNSGSKNVYRLGHKGKMDLKYLQDAPGPFYYKEHLPILGEPSDAASAVAPCQFKVGDKVRVDLDVEILKIMQEGHGGWNQKMAEFIGKIGTVHRITERGDVRVQYDGCTNRWTFHSGALTKVLQFNVGDTVQIINKPEKVRELQPGHGEWTDNMMTALGKKGKVLKVYSDGDLRVNVGDHTWTFNPQCCLLVPAGGPTPDNNDMACAPDREDTSAAFNSMIEKFLTTAVSTRQSDPVNAVPSSDVLVREAAQGHLEKVQEIIGKFPDKIDEKSSGKTALQVASHQGNLPIVQYLLQQGASLEIRDEDGDSALHYSAFGNQPELTDLLLKSGATINALNKAGCSTLHVAVNKQHAKCVKVLLKYKCDVNIQDSYGDTALHDAIGKDNREIMEMLVSYPQSDFSLKNKRGFNALHHAALKGNKFATEKILLRNPQLVNTKKDDGFAALHLAALNGHKDVVDALTSGNGDIEIQNNRKQTALLLAVSQGHMHIIDLLLSKGANVRTEDEDGDTCVHLALMRQSLPGEAANSPLLEPIKAQLTSDDLKSKPGVAIACYLIQKGAGLHHKNRHGKTPLDIVTDAKLMESLRKCAGEDLQSKGEPAQIPHNECLVCNEEAANVTFEPCGHMVTCVDCCKRMKKCVRCQQPIRKKLRLDGSPLYAPAGRQQSADSNTDTQLKEMERRMQEMEDSVMCGICMDKKKNVAFLCGHSACSDCVAPLKNCHMCRKPITKRINLF